MLWNLRRYIYKVIFKSPSYSTKTKGVTFVWQLLAIVFTLVVVFRMLIYGFYIIAIMFLFINLILAWTFFKELTKYLDIRKGMKEHKKLKSYYLPNYWFEDLQNKYYEDLMQKIDVYFCLYCDDCLTYEQRKERKENEIKKIYDYLMSTEQIKSEFEKIYLIKLSKTLCEIILQSVMVYFVIKNQIYSVDIFLSKSSILYLAGDYPINYRRYKDKLDRSILDYSYFLMCKQKMKNKKTPRHVV